ncbi:hypothetical protein [Dyella caseinilytica]|uniref:Methylaspartate ammonia-lyase n=1 Tax=Dyella caseinilytica TaxID=1849581 RepID=A0ABX7GZ12_9GAMM|nr:hypothetical protein [Dyella caseinilytica]QRN54410.1 hypothetical protein ISN74_03245 [Dyella caseinilytica]GFZ94016.1 hypothetical protein GCM10011408_12270 [Dyella caseinilytica]
MLMRRHSTASAALLFSMLAFTHTAAADNSQQQLASSSCMALHAAAAAIPGSGPMLLPSYPTLTQATGTSRALANVAFVYDNALAGIALTACGEPAQAQRIADAFLLAAAHDPTFKDGRLRNAYRSGVIQSDKIQLPGYWQSNGNYWSQDPYQVGTATGNVAWAALLLLTVYDSTHDRRYLDGAVAQLNWIQTHTSGGTAPPAYEGGLFGYDNAQQAQHWKATEHNIDVYAAATWAARETGNSALTQQAKLAASFVNAMWDNAQHRFLVGTLDDGKTLSRDKSGLDAQAWPLLAFEPHPTAWNQVWTWIDAQHRSGDGYGYMRHPDGIWTEGTAQVATAMQASGKPVPDALWQLLANQRSDGGMLYATPQARISTDFAIGPTSTYADFFYYHQPHLGATAWTALAAKAWNPFTGQPINRAENTP